MEGKSIRRVTRNRKIFSSFANPSPSPRLSRRIDARQSVCCLVCLLRSKRQGGREHSTSVASVGRMLLANWHSRPKGKEKDGRKPSIWERLRMCSGIEVLEFSNPSPFLFVPACRLIYAPFNVYINYASWEWLGGYVRGERARSLIAPCQPKSRGRTDADVDGRFRARKGKNFCA